MLSPGLEGAIEGALLRLTANFGVFVDQPTFAVLLSNWTGVIDRHEWVTVDHIDEALAYYLDRATVVDAERKLPPVGDFLEVCRTSKVASAAKAKPDILLAARPADAPRFSRADWNHHYAAGTLRGRDGIVDPTADEIAARATELVRDGRLLPPDAAPQVQLRDVVRVDWRDGTTSVVKVLDEDHAGAATRWMRQHDPAVANRMPQTPPECPNGHGSMVPA